MSKTIRLLATTALFVAAHVPLVFAQQAVPQPSPSPATSEAFRGINNFELVVRRPTGFREFEPRRQLDVTVGETLFFYAEPVGFGLMDQDGRRRLNMRIAYEFRDARDQIVESSPNPRLIQNEFETNSNRIWLSLSHRVPQLAPGPYKVRVLMTDGFTDRWLAVERQVTVTNAAPAPAPQAAPAQPRTTPPQAQAPTRPPVPAPRAATPPAVTPPAARAQAIVLENLQRTEAPATGFRAFTQRASNVYAPGQQINVYFEPRNVRTRFDGRALIGGLTIDLTVMTQAGQFVGRQAALWKLPLSIPSAVDAPPQNLYAAIGTGLNLPAGNYRIVLRVNDDLGGTSADLEFQVVIQGAPVAQQAPAPQAQAPQAQAPAQQPAPTAPAQPGSHLPRSLLQ